MAAADYYMSLNAYELPGNKLPHGYPAQAQPLPPQPQYQQPPNNAYSRPHAASFSTPPPAYAPIPTQPQPPQQQLQTYNNPPPPPQSGQQQSPPLKSSFAHPPYPTGPEPFPNPQIPQNSHLGVPLQPYRSHSQPAAPRVRFADQDSSSDSSSSDTDGSRRRRRRHKQHDSTQSRSHEEHDDRPRSSGSSSSRRHGHHETRAQRKEHKDRDTFLGAGVGGLVGDMIVPGLGTAAGLLLGGFSGRKYASKDKGGSRSKSEDARSRHREDEREHGRDYEDGSRRRGHRDVVHDGIEGGRRRRHGDRGGYSDTSESDLESGYTSRRHRRRAGEKGWDERSATYKSGTAVR